MNEPELRVWCAQLQHLRVLVEELEETHLKESAPPRLSLKQRRHWAANVIRRCRKDVITQRPVNLLDDRHVREHKEEMLRLGCSQRGVILRQPREQKQVVEHLLDFPFEDGRQIADIFCELFGEHPSSIVWLNGVRGNGQLAVPCQRGPMNLR